MTRAQIRRVTRQALVWLQVVLLVYVPTVAVANPNDGVVAAGAATISNSGNVTTITQSSDRAVINWGNFSIGANEVTNFVQPGVTSATLNRVNAGNPSEILGALNANGQVYLINPNGIVVGNGASINVGGMIMSTLDVTTESFMQGGALNFKGDSNAQIINFGEINADVGNIALIAAYLHNHGNITAAGTVALVASQDVTVSEEGVVTINTPTGDAEVLNTGLVQGGRVMLQAGAGSSVLESGVERSTLVVKKNGRVYLTHAGGKVLNEGDVRGNDVQVAATNIEYGGSTETAQGGNVSVVASGHLSVAGTIVSPGGFVDTSGKSVFISPDTAVVVGNIGPTVGTGGTDDPGGTWLIDPIEFTIGPAVATPDLVDTVAAATLNGGGNLMVSSAIEGVGTVKLLPGTTIAKTAGGDQSITVTVDNDFISDGTAAMPVSLTSTSGRLDVNVVASGAVRVSHTTIDTNGGTLDLTGMGHAEIAGSGGADVTLAAQGTGILIEESSVDTRVTVGSHGDGSVRLFGIGAPDGVGGVGHGVKIDKSTINIGIGNLLDGPSSADITGITSALADGSHGVYITNDTSLTQSGPQTHDPAFTGFITISGTGSTESANDNFGVFIESSLGTVSATTADISLSGTGGGTGTGNGNVGIMIDASSVKSLGTSINGVPGTKGAATVSLQGFGGFGKDGNAGVVIDNASVVTSIAGDLTIEGTGGGQIDDGLILDTAVNSDITTAIGRYGKQNAGVLVDNGSEVKLNFDLTDGGSGLDRDPLQNHPTMGDDPELMVIGQGGRGLDENAGVVIGFTAASTVQSTDADLMIVGTAGGVPDLVTVPLVTGDPLHLDGTGALLPIPAMTDPNALTDFAELFKGKDNAGVYIGNSSTVGLVFDLPTIDIGGGVSVNRTRFDDISLDVNNDDDFDDDLATDWRLDPILSIDGRGGIGGGGNVGVEINTLDTLHLSNDAHASITGVAGGASRAAIDALIANTNLNDDDGTTGFTVDGMKVEGAAHPADAYDFGDITNQTLIDAIVAVLGTENIGIDINGLGTVVQMTDDGVATVAGVTVALPDMTEFNRPEFSTGRLTLNGFGGLGTGLNDGIIVDGLGAGISVEDGDLYMNGYGGGTNILGRLDSQFYGLNLGANGLTAGDTLDSDQIFSPRFTDSSDGTRTHLVHPFKVVTDDLVVTTIDLDSNPNAAEFIVRNQFPQTGNDGSVNNRNFIDNILERSLSAAELQSLNTLYGDGNTGITIEGLGAFVAATDRGNLWIDGHGGSGQDMNYGVYLSGLGAHITVHSGNNVNPYGVQNIVDLDNLNNRRRLANLADPIFNLDLSQTVDDRTTFDGITSGNGIAGLNIDGRAGGIPDAVVQGMIENASKLNFPDDDNALFAGVGDDSNPGVNDIPQGDVVSNSDLIDALWGPANGIYGTSDNKGVFATGLGVTIEAIQGMAPSGLDTATLNAPGLSVDGDTLQQLQDKIDAMTFDPESLTAAETNTLLGAIAEITAPAPAPNNPPAGNISIVGVGGTGRNNNMGVHVTGLGAQVLVESGNMDIYGFAGGTPVEVLKIDRVSNGTIIANNGSGTRTLFPKVDKLFERDMSGADIGLLANSDTKIFGDNNKGFLLEGLGAKAVSSYVEPSFMPGEVLSTNIRDNLGYFLTGNTDESGLFTADLNVGRDDLNDNGTRHPDARHLKIAGYGGNGSSNNLGLEVNGLGAKVETDSADIHLKGKAGGTPTYAVHSLIENAKDTFFDVPEDFVRVGDVLSAEGVQRGGTTDRTDLIDGGFSNQGVDDDNAIVMFDNNEPMRVGNGFHVAADTRDVIQAMDEWAGDGNIGIKITGLGAKVHAKTGTPGTFTPPDLTATVTVPTGFTLDLIDAEGNDNGTVNGGDTVTGQQLLDNPAFVLTPPDAEAPGGDIADAVAAGAAAETEGDTVESTANTAAASATTEAQGETILNNALEDGLTGPNSALADGEQAVQDGLDAVDDAVSDSVAAAEQFLADAKAATEGSITPGMAANTTAGNVFMSGYGGYGEADNFGIEVNGLGAKVIADLGNIHMRGMGGGLPESWFNIQGDLHTLYDGTTANPRNYRSDRLFEIDMDATEWGYFVAGDAVSAAPNGEASDGLFAGDNKGVFITGLGAGVESTFKEPPALRMFYRAQDSVAGEEADRKFAWSNLSPDSGNPLNPFENYVGYNDTQESGRGDGFANDEVAFIGNGIFGNTGDDYDILNSPLNADVITNAGVPINTSPNGSGGGDGTHRQDDLLGDEYIALGNSGTSLDILPTALSGTDATSKGELVVVNPGAAGENIAAHLIPTGNGKFLTVDNLTGEGNFFVDGDNLGESSFLVGVNDNARLTYDGNGDLVNMNQLVDGPGSGYQTGIPVLMKRVVDIQGTGGYGDDNNHGFELNGLGAHVTSTAADISIRGDAGGIQSNVVRNAIENLSDVTPINIAQGTDRIADFSADQLTITGFGDGEGGAADTHMITLAPDFRADLDQFTINGDNYTEGPDGIVDDFSQTILDHANFGTDLNYITQLAGEGSAATLGDLLDTRVGSEELLGGPNKDGNGLINLYGDSNKGSFITGLGAKVEATLTQDLYWADQGDMEIPLGTDGTEMFNYTTGDPNAIAIDGAGAVTHPLASTRPLALNAVEDETFADLTGNLRNSTDLTTTLVSGNHANAGAAHVPHNEGNFDDGTPGTTTLTDADLTNESAAVTRAAIAEAADSIIVTSRVSRANVSVLGSGGTGKSHNMGVHATGLGVKIAALSAVTGSDAGNVLIDGIGGGIPVDGGSLAAAYNIIAIDHAENLLTDKLLETDFTGEALKNTTYGLPALIGSNNHGVFVTGLGATVESGFQEPFVPIAPVNPMGPGTGELDVLRITEHYPDPLRRFVNVEEDSTSGGNNEGLPIVASRDMQIIGDGGVGTNNNKGVFLSGLGAKFLTNSADIFVRGNTRVTTAPGETVSGIPSVLTQSMIENASDVIWNGPEGEDNDRLPDGDPVTNSDLIDAIALIYGDNNFGFHVTGLGAKVQSTDTDVSSFVSNFNNPSAVDPSRSYNALDNDVPIGVYAPEELFGEENFGNVAGTGNITITGYGGHGQSSNIGVQANGLGVKIQSGVGTIQITGRGGGVPDNVIAIDGTPGNGGRNYLVDKLLERDLSSDDVLKFSTDIYGNENKGFVLLGLGAKVQSDYVEPVAGSGAAPGEQSLVNSPWRERFIRDLDGNFLTGQFSGDTFRITGSNDLESAYIAPNEHPLYRHVTIHGDAGRGVSDNLGVEIVGLGAKVASQSADITIDGNFHGVIYGDQPPMPSLVLQNLIENAKDVTPAAGGGGPTLYTDRTDGVFQGYGEDNFIFQTVIDPATGQPIVDINGNVASVDTIISTQGNTVRIGNGIHVAATNASVIEALDNLLGDRNKGVLVQGLGAKVHAQDALFGGNVTVRGYGGTGQGENIGVEFNGLGVKAIAEHGSVNIRGNAGGVATDTAIGGNGLYSGGTGFLEINNDGHINRLFEADMDADDLVQFTTTDLIFGDNNIGVKIQGLGAKVQSNFKEPPALRQFVDPETGYVKYAFAYKNPFGKPKDFHGEPDFSAYGSPNGSDTLPGGLDGTNGVTDATNKGTLVIVDRGEGRFLIPDLYGELVDTSQVGAENDFVLNDNGALAPSEIVANNGFDVPGPESADGTPVVQRREVNIIGYGGNGKNTNYGVQLQGLGAKITSNAANIWIDGDAGGIPSGVINSLIENAADITPGRGRDRIDDFSADEFGIVMNDGDVDISAGSDFIADLDQLSNGDGLFAAVNGIRDDIDTELGTVTAGAEDPYDTLDNIIAALGSGPNADDALQVGVSSDVILQALIDLYGDTNIGVLGKGLGVKVQSTLTPEQLPWHSMDMLQPLGTVGTEEVNIPVIGDVALQDLPTTDISALTDDQRTQLRADIAEAADTILLTSRIARGSVTIDGYGGTGKSDNKGIHWSGLGAKIIADHMTAGDAGDIYLHGLGGGIPMNVLAIGGNGRTDTLLETDMTAVDIVVELPKLFGDGSDGIHVQGLGSGVESTFLEPFVPAGPIGIAMALEQNDDYGVAVNQNADGSPIVAVRTVKITGYGNAVGTIGEIEVATDHVGINDNRGVFFEGLGTHAEAVSSNLLVNGVGGGMELPFLRNLITNANDDLTESDRLNDRETVVGDDQTPISFVPGTSTRDSNTDVIAAIGALLGDNNKGIELSGLGATFETTDSAVSAPNSIVGNLSMIGRAGYGTSHNTGVDINGLGATAFSGVGNMIVEGFGGGVPTDLIVSNENGFVDRVLELFELAPGDVEDLSTESVYGEMNHGVLVSGLGANVTSEFFRFDLGPAYNYRANSARNPFFLDGDTLPKPDASGFVQVLKTDMDGGAIIPHGGMIDVQGQGILRDDLVGGLGRTGEGREVVVAGRGGTGLSQNKGVFLDGGSVVSTDADIDIDGLGGGMPDAVIAELHAGINNGLGPDFINPTGLLYGSSNNVGVEINSLGGVSTLGLASGYGVIEINGTGGTSNHGNIGILITGASGIEGASDVTLVGKGGGILNVFNDEYDGDGTLPVRERNHGIEISGASGVTTFGALLALDPYRVETERLARLVLDGMVGNNAELGNGSGEVDFADPTYVNDLGGPSIDDAGILIDGASGVEAEAADVDLFADMDLIIRGASGVGNVAGNVSLVATRHLEVSGASSVDGADDVTVAWDMRDPESDTTGRLKVGGSSGFTSGGELNLYGFRRGSTPMPFGANALTPAPGGRPDAFNNEISTTATFNGFPWTNVGPGDGTVDPVTGPSNAPAVDSGDHELEFCNWEQEQWSVVYDLANRTSLADSDRFDTTQDASVYNFGNPQGPLGYNGSYGFWYGSESIPKGGISPDFVQIFADVINFNFNEGGGGTITVAPGVAGLLGDGGDFGVLGGDPSGIVLDGGNVPDTQLYDGVGSLLLGDLPAGTYNIEDLEGNVLSTFTLEGDETEEELQQILQQIQNDLAGAPAGDTASNGERRFILRRTPRMIGHVVPSANDVSTIQVDSLDADTFGGE